MSLLTHCVLSLTRSITGGEPWAYEWEQAYSTEEFEAMLNRGVADLLLGDSLAIVVSETEEGVLG